MLSCTGIPGVWFGAIQTLERDASFGHTGCTSGTCASGTWEKDMDEQEEWGEASNRHRGNMSFFPSLSSSRKARYFSCWCFSGKEQVAFLTPISTPNYWHPDNHSSSLVRIWVNTQILQLSMFSMFPKTQTEKHYQIGRHMVSLATVLVSSLQLEPESAPRETRLEDI